MKTKKDNSYQIIQQIKQNDKLAEELSAASDILFNLYLKDIGIIDKDMLNEFYDISKTLDRFINQLNINSKKIYSQLKTN